MYICILLIILILITLLLITNEHFDMDSYLRRNYQSGAGMIRGDLNIQPVQQSWFNTAYGPSILTPGFMNM